MTFGIQKRSDSGRNNTCPLPKDEHLILLISIACAGATAVLSLWLILKHLHRYTQQKQQRQIIRIIATPIVFAFLSVLAILSYDAANYIIPPRDLYEAFALAGLFLLFVEYVAPDQDTRDAYFFNLENPRNRGSIFSRSKSYDVIPRGSLKWFRAKRVAIFGYCIVMAVTTAAMEITQAVGIYCQTSLSPRFAQIWIIIIQNVAIAVAVTCLFLFYGRLAPEIAEHKPFVKIMSFKSIIGVNFIQSLAFSLLTGNNILKGTYKVTGKDLSVGIPALLVSFERILFAISFHYSFRSREYHESETSPAKRMSTLRAAAHAYNPCDLLYGMVYAVVLAKGGIGPREEGEWQKSRGRRYARISEQENVHLEPLSGAARPGRTNGGYGYQSFPGEESRQDYAAEDYQRIRSASQTLVPHRRMTNQNQKRRICFPNASSYTRRIRW